MGHSQSGEIQDTSEINISLTKSLEIKTYLESIKKINKVIKGIGEIKKDIEISDYFMNV